MPHCCERNFYVSCSFDVRFRVEESCFNLLIRRLLCKVYVITCTVGVGVLRLVTLVDRRRLGAKRRRAPVAIIIIIAETVREQRVPLNETPTGVF